MLKDRIIAALVLIAIIVPTLIWGGEIGVTILVALVVFFGLSEIANGLPDIKENPSRNITIIIGLAVVFAFYLLPLLGLLGLLALLPLFILCIHLAYFTTIQNTHLSSSQMIMAIGYVAIPLSHAVLMRKLDSGIAWIFYMLVVVALGDASAYFCGKYFGKRKLAPKISPAKTYEGLAGVFAGGLVGMFIVKTLAEYFRQPLPPYGLLVPLTLILALVGPLGDLIASALKRKMGLKDFGSILPGHGGFLDRADSHILAFPTAYYFLIFFQGAPGS